MLLTRRGLFGGAIALLAAPAIIRTPGLLMPVVRPLRLVVRRHAVMVQCADRPEYATIYRMTQQLPDFPAWITEDMPHIYNVRDYGWEHGFGWQSEAYVRA